MPAVTIAFCNETWWLVRGESHLHDMLAAKEAPELEIEIVTCRVWAEVLRLWEAPEFGKMPWAINPKIIERLKSRANTTVT
ncbi:MAG TPA: hypothetical protein VMA53_00445 [Stellaceae bacterium]|nr:hypothetical protein [Stellaceae bacterium]